MRWHWGTTTGRSIFSSENSALPSTSCKKQCHRETRADEIILIQTDDSNAEVFDIFDDPHEQHDLHAILPEQAETLQKRLHTFIYHVTVIDTTEVEEIEEFDDPQVYRRLRDLGYLE